MRNPFKRSGSHNPYQYSGPGPSSNKLIIVAGVITFVVIIIVMFESVVVVEAGHRGVVLYVGAVHLADQPHLYLAEKLVFLLLASQ